MVIPAPSFPIGVLLNFLPIERLRGGGARQSNAELVSGVCMQIHCLPFLAIFGRYEKLFVYFEKSEFLYPIRSLSYSFVHY